MRVATVLALLSALLGASLVGGCASVTEGELMAPTRDRPELGLRLRVVEPGALPAKVLGDRARVLLVIAVAPERPAALAGVEPGELLLSLDGRPVSGMADSVALMQNRGWGEEVVLTLWRDGRLRDLPLSLQPRQRTRRGG